SERRTTVFLRPPTPLDIDGMARLWKAMHQELRQEEPRRPAPPERDEDWVPPEADSTPDPYAQRVTEWFEDPDIYMLVGVKETPAPEAVAYVVMRVLRPEASQGEGEEPTGRLIGLYVRPSLRRNGLGTRLLGAACGW